MSQPPNVVAVAEGLTSDAFHQILDLAIEGKGKLPGAKVAAKNLLVRHRDPEVAVDWVVREHIALAGGQGFATNCPWTVSRRSRLYVLQSRPHESQPETVRTPATSDRLKTADFSEV